MKQDLFSLIKFESNSWQVIVLIASPTIESHMSTLLDLSFQSVDPPKQSGKNFDRYSL